MNEELTRLIADAERRLARLEVAERPLVLRGWRDDFLGDSLYAQYSTASIGAGSSGALRDSAHGGVYRLASGPNIGDYFTLYLGGGLDTLDADAGWTQIVRCRISSTASILAIFGGVVGGGAADFIEPCIDTTVNANWRFRLRAGGGAITHVDSGIAADTSWHVHGISAHPLSAGERQVDHWLDGAMINSYTVTANISGAVMEPFAICYSLAAVSKWLDIDYWVIVPN